MQRVFGNHCRKENATLHVQQFIADVIVVVFFFIRVLENKLGVYILRKSENAQSKRVRQTRHIRPMYEILKPCFDL